MNPLTPLSCTRRIALGLACAAGLLGVAVMAPAQAAAPAQKTQVPGFYRHQVGDFEVTVLHDGQLELDTKILKNATPQQLQQLMARMFRNNPAPTAVNAFLVNTGSQLVLIDTGAAKLFGPGLGQVLANLKAAGYTPEQVDAVFITHLHGDHVGGVLGADGQIAFPNATVYVAQQEADFWLDQGVMAKAPKEAQAFFQMAQSSVAPYAAAGKLKTFKGDVELVPGIKAVATPGHTPGHTSYLIESKGQRLLVMGDLVHNFAVQFARPDVAIEFDVDSKAAVVTRKKVFAQAAKERLTVAGAHLPFPGLGNVRTEPKGAYTYVPIDFSLLK
jgi:glyoxylase-like metal-dependent hydrolase (beta-lactamase superfamily II)